MYRLSVWKLSLIIAVFLFIGFHLGLEATFTLALFPHFCIVGWLAFLPTGLTDTIVFSLLFLILVIRPNGLFGKTAADLMRGRQ